MTAPRTTPHAGTGDEPDVQDEVEGAIAAELLAELGRSEPGGDLDRDEEADATAAVMSARLLHRTHDRALYERLAQRGFSGPEYEIFRMELASYSLPVIRSWLRTGLIFSYCARQGRPIVVSDYDRHDLEDVDERIGLANETVARALNLFHDLATSGSGWSHEGGAAITTYFVGTCVKTFPNIFRNWQRLRDRSRRDAEQYAPFDEDGRTASDHSEEVLTRQALIATLEKMPQAMRRIAFSMAFEDKNQAELAADMGLTERSIEGRLYRYRKELERRRSERRKG